jgi:hypothetical protein
MSERRHLEVFHEEPPAPPAMEKREGKESESAHEKIAKAFLKQRYPLTEEGLTLRREVEKTLASGDRARIEMLRDRLPTVEKPHLELFRDLEIPKEREEELFGRDLANVQVTKGCRHKCTFCAAGAASKVEVMPFPAVLKVAEKKRERDRLVEEAWQRWVKLIKDKTGFDLENWTGSFLVNEVCEKEFPSFPGADLIAVEEFDEMTFPASRSRLLQQIENYYDSDPFDYRDAAFLHDDGAPADYGDVCVSLASRPRPIHITTAGWPLNDHVAQRAAEKIVALGKKDERLLLEPRISVNRYEATARRDLKRYLADMENVIQTLTEIKPEVLLFYEKNDLKDKEFITKVVKPIQKRALEDRRVMPPRKAHGGQVAVSLFSGPMMDEPMREDHHDVMACMPGIHIWPDGTVARQAGEIWIPDKSGSSAKHKAIPTGSRPTPTGDNIFPK